MYTLTETQHDEKDGKKNNFPHIQRSSRREGRRAWSGREYTHVHAHSQLKLLGGEQGEEMCPMSAWDALNT